MDAGVADSVNGTPTWRMTPQAGCSISMVIARATASGEANAARMSLIGPAGMSAASRTESHSAEVRSRNRSASVGRSSARRSTRSPFVAKRGSSASAGRPSATHTRGHWRSEPTATAISPSAVSNVSYGTMLGCALPRRPGATPDTNAFWAWLTSADSVEASSEMSMRWPVPDAGPSARSRATSDASTLTAPSIPVITSLIATPTFDRATTVLVRRAGDRHEAARGLDDEVVARSVRSRSVGAVAGDGEVDQARIQPLELVVIEAEAREATRPEVLDQDVAAAEEPPQDLGARRPT